MFFSLFILGVGALYHGGNAENQVKNVVKDRKLLKEIPPPTAIKYYTQRVDHFNYQNKKVYHQRYFIYDVHYRAGGPMLFYTGNEGPLESFYYNTGLPFDWADELGALIIFAEHRYYGQSLPFGETDSFSVKNLGYLSVKQTLMDYAKLVENLKAEYAIEKVVAMGGSYGGMLAAWARIQYPAQFDMALSASAPIRQVQNKVNATAFFKIITEDAKKADEQCPDSVRRGFVEAAEAFKTAEGRRKINQLFNLCSVPDESEWSHFMQFVRNGWTTMAMCDYPYPTNFLAPLPGNPIKVACKEVVESPLEGLGAATQMPYKTNDRGCIDMYVSYIECADQTGCGEGNDAKAWDYQMCTDMYYDQTTNNVTDMFPPRKWTVPEINQYCMDKYGVKPDGQDIGITLGGIHPEKVTSRIIFSNGVLDPWYSGGYTETLSADLPAVIIESGAHHLDLRLAHKDDPQDVIDARIIELNYIKSWLGLRHPEESAQYYI